MLQGGYRIPFAEEPESYVEENNLSAKENMQFVREQVQKLVSKGVVKALQERPRCINPLTVASKILEGGERRSGSASTSAGT